MNTSVVCFGAIAVPSVTANQILVKLLVEKPILMILYRGLITNFHSALNNVANVAVILFKCQFLKERADRV